MGINGRSKGNKGERVAAAVLSDWTNKKFARVPSSGGLQWKNSNAKGDIVCTEEGHFFPFCVEVKSYAELNFEHLLYLDKAEVLKFWAQCIRDANLAKKCPILMMRYNGLPKKFFFIAIPAKIYHHHFSEHIKRPRAIHILEHDLVLFTTNELKDVPYKKIRKPIKTLYKV